MEIIIIGGGASGMMAAIIAARNGNQVTLIEKNDMLGKKLLATGNGRCNFTNLFCTPNDYFGKEQFAKSSFDRFGVKETLKFFRELGILEREEGEGRVYPFSAQGASVLEALRYEIESLGINVLLSTKVNKTSFKAGKFILQTENGKEITGDRLILATGGKAGPVYGSTGDGYKFAEQFGHKINNPRPALVKLICQESYFVKLKGVRAKGKVSIKSSNKSHVYSDTGEIQFTENGISGICVFNISRFAGDSPTITAIDFFPEFREEELISILMQRKGTMGDRPIGMILNGMINSKIIPVLLSEIGVEKRIKNCKDLDSEIIKSIIQKLKNWTLQVKKIGDFNDAQTTVGGIDLSQVSQQTMESKLLPGLYFTGEVLDMDAKCGGYNLQWAWTSGYIAGASCGGNSNC